jgi:hypothetical protein
MSDTTTPPTWRVELEGLIRAEIREQVVANTRQKGFDAVFSRRPSDFIDAETTKIMSAAKTLALPTFLTKLDAVSLLAPLSVRWDTLPFNEKKRIAAEFKAHYYRHQGLYAKTD